MAPAGAVEIISGLCAGRGGVLTFTVCLLKMLCKDLRVAVASGAEDSAGVTVLGIGTSRSLYTDGWVKPIPAV